MEESESTHKTSRTVASLDKAHKATSQDIVTIKESIGMLSQTQGEMLRKLIETDSDIGGIRRILTSIHDEFVKRNKICDGRHEDIDERFDSISDVECDFVDTDTGVFESMSGGDVKNMITEERKAREALQAQVDAMRRQDEIHKAEKNAVKRAKEQWDEKNKKLEEEQNKTKDEHTKIKTARYGMYAAIGVAAISAVATMSVSVLNMMDKPERPVAVKVEGGP